MRTYLVWLWLSVIGIVGCAGERIVTKAVTEEMVVVWAEYTASYSTINVSPEIWSLGQAGYGTEGFGASIGGLVFTKKTVPEQYVSIFQSPKRGEIVSQCEEVYRAVKARRVGEKIVLRLQEKYSVSCPNQHCDGGAHIKLLDVSVIAVL